MNLKAGRVTPCAPLAGEEPQNGARRMMRPATVNRFMVPMPVLIWRCSLAKNRSLGRARRTASVVVGGQPERTADGGGSPANRAGREMATGHFMQSLCSGFLSKPLETQLFIGIPAKIFNYMEFIAVPEDSIAGVFTAETWA